MAGLVVVPVTAGSICCSVMSLFVPKPFDAWLFVLSFTGFLVVIAIVSLYPHPVTLSQETMAELRQIAREGCKGGE